MVLLFLRLGALHRVVGGGGGGGERRLLTDGQVREFRRRDLVSLTCGRVGIGFGVGSTVSSFRSDAMGGGGGRGAGDVGGSWRL